MKRMITVIIVVAILLNGRQLTTAQTAALPIVTGDFMQGWQFAIYSGGDIESLFRQMSEVGIRYVILTESARTESGHIRESYYPARTPAANAPYGNNLIEYMLTAAEETGIRVFLGLNYDGDWWTQCWRMNDKTWYTAQAEHGNEIAQELYDLYKEDFPNAFYGWYFSFEFFNNMQNQEANFADFININRDFLWELDPSMPMLMSPFMARDHKNPADTKTELLKFFEFVNFKEGDIYAPQDCVGVGRASIEEAILYFRNIREALNEKKPGINLWANNENFIDTWGNYQPGPVDRFINQIEAVNPFVDGHITFSYSHYYSTLRAGNNTYHNAYRAYYQHVLEQRGTSGDINDDGFINAADATLLRRYLAANNKEAFRAENLHFNLQNADINGDGNIDEEDLLRLRRLLAAN